MLYVRDVFYLFYFCVGRFLFGGREEGKKGGRIKFRGIGTKLEEGKGEGGGRGKSTGGKGRTSVARSSG